MALSQIHPRMKMSQVRRGGVFFFISFCGFRKLSILINIGYFELLDRLLIVTMAIGLVANL